MADLDDFFAKKDRKKAKGKKFTTTEEIAKKLEETGKKVDKTKSKDKPQNAEGGDDSLQINEDDEWKVFEEEKKDYTGLKIGNLSVTEVPHEITPHDDGEGGENGSDCESREGGKHGGPWKKASVETPAPAPPPAPVVVPQPEAPPPPVSNVYRPPCIKNPPPPMDRPFGRLKKNVAPDINSEEYFPTLNSKQPAANDAGVWGRKKRDEGNFEEVRNRGANRTYGAPETQNQTPKLSLGNKYGALSQDQS